MTTNQNGWLKETDFTYDQYNNVTDQKDCEGNCQNGVLREIQTTYNTNPSYLNLNILSLPLSTTILDGNAKPFSYTLFYYDEYQYRPLQDDPGIVGHDAAYNTGFSPRGNLTTIWRSQNGSTNVDIIGAQYTFDIAGNVVAEYDGKGNRTTIGYNDDGQNRYALPTSVTNALNQTTRFSYDYNVAEPVSSTDANNATTQYAYNDPLDRLTQISLANGGKVYYTYPSTTQVVTQQDENSSGDGALKSRQVYDGFGRPIESDVFESGSQYIATTQSYDALGRVAMSRNPSRLGDSLNFPTSYSYDALGRVTQVTAQDGSPTTTAYTGNTVTVTDAASRKKQYTYDALGRLFSVAEDPNGLSFFTNYRYDALGNLTLVSQGNCPNCQQRGLAYDGLSRLTQTANPESGTTTYAYDSANNLISRQDNRGIQTTYSYDALNRLTGVSYSDGRTPATSLAYDAGTVANSKGRLTGISNGNSITNYTSFDAMGNVMASDQVTGGKTYAFSYAYNLAGSLISEAYPSGRVVTTTYDGANRPSTLSANVSGQQKTYISQAGYWPQGALGFYAYGNNVWPVFTYNSQLQQSCKWDTIGNNPNYYLFTECANWGGSNNNGNLQVVTVQAGGPGPLSSLPTFTGSFSYDSLNRLTAASDSGGWSRSFNYDQWGNMWVSGSSGVPLAGNTPTSNVYSPINNRINGQQYDAAGNHTSANGNTLSYDAENHVISVTEAPAFGGGSETIAYDGTGQRVQKTISGGPTTVYVYDAFGQLAAEYSNAAPTTPACQTCYLSYDHLGSVRLVTDQSANVIARHDYLPFGEEVPSGVAGRNSQFGATDYVNPRFTGQMRDSEMGLDYFNARYFGSALGRFTSLDPGSAGADMYDPQTWNGYSYVRNSPMSNTDPTGADICPDGSYADACVTDTPDPVSSDPCFYFNCWGGSEPGGRGPAPAPVTVMQPVPKKPQQPPKNVCAVPPLPGRDANAQLQRMIGEMQNIAYAGETAKATLFTLNFWPGHAWDYKSQYPRGDVQSVTQARIFGNFAFGAVMRASGLSYYEAQNAAGVAQIIFHAIGKGAPGEGTPLFRYPYGDQVQDAVDVQRGYDYIKALGQGSCH